MGAVRLSLCLLILVFPLFSGCTARKCAERSFFAMDTYMSFTAYGADEKLLQEAEEIVRGIEDRLSVTKEGSEIRRLNETGQADISEETAILLFSTLLYADMTRGALDPSIYPVTKLWGFTTGEYRVPARGEIEALLPLVDYTKIQITENEAGTSKAMLPEGAMIDLGAVAKGFTGVVLRDYLRQKGVQSALLDLGGNIQAVGKKPGGAPFQIAVKDPGRDGYLGVLSLDLPDLAVVTSGAYERYFEEGGVRYGHIMDPKTGRPAASGLLSVTVIHNDGVLCDAMSTALFVMGEERAIELWRKLNSFEFLIVTEDGRLLVSEGNEGRFTKDSGCAYKAEIVHR